MCATCGCGDEAATRVLLPLDVHPEHGGHPRHEHHEHEHDHHEHDHDHDDSGHGHGHGHDHHDHDHGRPRPEHPHEDASPAGQTISIEQDVLAKNDLLAARNRGWFEGREILAVNVMSSPGAGKTTLLERTIRELAADRDVAVVEGDQETLLDADRIRATGAPVVQINTGAGCHLDADMLRRGLDRLAPRPGSYLFVENVGNLVCPALFDLGEAARVVIISVTEGNDKPLKYPHMFASADLVLVNKADLLPFVDFDVERCVAQARQLNPRVQALVVSATTGEGFAEWLEWLAAHAPEREAVRAQQP
ncbi:hydrogenase nickel incorporation protein HypB [Georgenia thermotolerans]|uniref:Hydrogenase nickel incorporation protein HypB n=1 Tax=Georgenia thermotolerans TaxID=527326 RepID=A0A7J5UPJ0_9MICO|nr:hydrogenase nickel incorporation protein HypB [Georgenia thermotolerans]KAE8764325.1 hydrogenase nickel incorporation protein HypB [Georgenia thermotolerans]